MDTPRLIAALARPGAFPRVSGEQGSTEPEVIQTHISVIFLVGGEAFKVKKPLDLGFLDFTTLERRRHFCHEEVRLNRRLAPRVYLGVVPIVRDEDGRLVVDGEGEVVEYAVRMLRLPERATLLERLSPDDEGDVGADVVRALGKRVAGFHAEAASGPEVSRHARWETVAANARDNLVQTRPHLGRTVSARVHARLTLALERRLAALRPLIERRAARHVARDTHGDLHLDHVYLFPEEEPPDDLVIIDCIEFSERFRCADPVSDMAFLAMDLIRQGRPDLEAEFSRSYFEASGDDEGVVLLPFYRAYRAAVRAKVEGLVGGEGVPEDARSRAERRARGHWLLALSELEPPDRRPGLVLVGGLPGTGKSTVARRLAEAGGFRRISSDRTRKRLAGLSDAEDAEASFGEGLYTPEWTRRTYRACLLRARSELFAGERVLVDATFSHEWKRRLFLDAAQELGVRACFLVCTAPPATVRDRLERRAAAGGSAGPEGASGSDADWSIHREMAERWEPVSPATRRVHTELSTAAPHRETLERGLRILAGAGLLGREAALLARESASGGRDPDAVPEGG